ncbi:hypothetical protein QCE64_19750 [Caballeronia sp. LZ043]|nr:MULTISPECIES: hypothetical protein [unclassified Caballeronia]MDR5818710.1 hypothetical protein [Caballeronia sp. LZ033]MDR5822696.1 hypothetical protein [Caballeronia sp. LZ043]
MSVECGHVHVLHVSGHTRVQRLGAVRNIRRGIFEFCTAKERLTEPCIDCGLCRLLDPVGRLTDASKPKQREVIVIMNSTDRPCGPYTPTFNTTSATMLNRKEPTKVDNAFCVTLP